MRLLFLTPAYPPFPGGGERYVRALALELVAQGHAVTAVTSTAQTEADFWQSSGQEPISEKEGGVDIIRCGLQPFPGGRRGLMGWRKAMVLASKLPGVSTAVLQKMARRIPPLDQLPQTLAQLPPDFDIVHGFNISWEYPLLAAQRWAAAHRLPFVATPFAHLGTGNDKVARNSTMKHQLCLLQQAARVLVLTAVEQTELAARGVPPARLDVIYGGLDPLPALPDTAVVCQKHKVTNPFVVFVGRANYDKGALQAAQAILTCRQAGTDVSLLLVGQSSPEFDRFYRQLNRQEQQWIRPLGILSDAEKHSLIAESEMLLLPSRTDSFGIVLLEAWAHGKPVVAARAGGIPGVVDDGENGLLVPFGAVPELSEKIQSLLKDKTLQTRLGENGRQKTKTIFTWPQVAKRVMQNYRAILNEHTPTREI